MLHIKLGWLTLSLIEWSNVIIYIVRMIDISFYNVPYIVRMIDISFYKMGQCYIYSEDDWH
jgi:hypothetical protein